MYPKGRVDVCVLTLLKCVNNTSMQNVVKTALNSFDVLIAASQMFFYRVVADG